jgi:hypothetical protein
MHGVTIQHTGAPLQQLKIQIAAMELCVLLHGRLVLSVGTDMLFGGSPTGIVGHIILAPSSVDRYQQQLSCCGLQCKCEFYRYTVSSYHDRKKNYLSLGGSNVRDHINNIVIICSPSILGNMLHSF